MKEKLIEIISEINPFIEVDETTNLIDEEVLDSLGIIALIEEIEDAFKVKMDIGNIEVDDFRTLGTIMQIIEELLND